MATAAATRTARRAKPIDEEAMFWHRALHAFECRGCGEYFEVHSRRRYEDAEHMNMLREALLADHTECWEYDDPKMARDARRYRKEKKRRENLAAQRVSWRGRR